MLHPNNCTTSNSSPYKSMKGKGSATKRRRIVEQRPDVLVVSFPVLADWYTTPLSNLFEIFCAISGKLYAVQSQHFLNEHPDNRVTFFDVEHRASKNVLFRTINYVITQMKITVAVLKLRSKFDVCVFFTGGEGLALPALFVKLCRKKMLLGHTGSMVETGKHQNSVVWALKILRSFVRLMSDKIVVYSERIARQDGLEKYLNKVSIAHEHFLDLKKIRAVKHVGEKEDMVGYVGRFSQEKGILNFVKAIPMVLQKRESTQFVMIGNGAFFKEVKEFIRKNRLNGKVRFLGSVSHNDLPKYLNEIKLLVLPSYTEGLPNVMLEGMACGTPVLATCVGAVPDVIDHGKNGFFLENNSPECIAKNILEILDRKDLQEISCNARKVVEGNFTYQAAVEGYKEALRSLLML